MPKLTLPPLFHTHPGFAAVMLAELILHFGLGTAAVVSDHTAPLWGYFGGDIGVRILGMIHLAAGMLMVTGAYIDFRLARKTFLLSVSIYIWTAGCAAAALIVPWALGETPASTGETLVWALAACVISVAATREPVTPGAYGDLDAS